MRSKNDNPTDLEMELLALLGNDKPTVAQTALMKKLVKQANISQQLLFDKRLSPQERNCLFYAALGYSARETAALLKCEAPTIKHYRYEILKKLRCANIAQAIFVGIRYGYLYPSKEKEEENALFDLANGRDDSF